MLTEYFRQEPRKKEEIVWDQPVLLRPQKDSAADTICGTKRSSTVRQGYRIVFSVLISFMAKLSFQNFFWKLLLLPGVELTGGIRMLCQLDLTSELRYATERVGVHRL